MSIKIAFSTEAVIDLFSNVENVDYVTAGC